MIGYILLNQMSMKTHVHHLLHEIPHLDNKSGEPYAKLLIGILISDRFDL